MVRRGKEERERDSTHGIFSLYSLSSKLVQERCTVVLSHFYIFLRAFQLHILVSAAVQGPGGVEGGTVIASGVKGRGEEVEFVR